MSFAEKGDVGDIDPAFFIGYLHRVKATGTLKFEDAPIQRAVYFRDGRVLFSSSNAPEDQLGAILVAGGRINQAQFDAIVAALEPKQSIASALAQGGHVSQKDIGEAARRKVEQIVGACCAQATGRYEFEDGVLPKGALDLKLTTEKVLVSAFEGLEPSGFLNRVLKSPMAVLAPADVEPSDSDLARVRAALDGVSSLADVGGKLGLPLAATEARAAVLVVMGAATVVTSQIEEMTLPDTGESAASGLSLAPSDESEPVEAETLAFGQSPMTAETINLAPSEDESPVNTGSEATLMMPAADTGVGGSGLPSDSDATLVTGSGLGVPTSRSPSDSGLSRALGPGPKTQKASTRDLDAVKELIGSPAASRPGSASIPSQPWEPKLSAAGRPGRSRGGLDEMVRSPAFKRVAALVLVTAVGFLAWVAYSGSTAPRPAPPSAASPSPTETQSSTAAFATPPFATPAPSTSTSGGGKPVPAAASPVTPAAKATVNRTPIPTPKATPVQNPGPTPLAKATPPPPAIATPVVRSTPNQPAAGSGYDALKAGRLAEAAAAFETTALSRSGEFSVQLLVACSAQTIVKAIQNDSSPDLFILPATIGGKPCHRMMRGYFKTQAEATQAVSTLPPYYTAEGAKPRAVQIKSVIR